MSTSILPDLLSFYLPSFLIYIITSGLICLSTNYVYPPNKQTPTTHRLYRHHEHILTLTNSIQPNANTNHHTSSWRRRPFNHYPHARLPHKHHNSHNTGHSRTKWSRHSSCWRKPLINQPETFHKLLSIITYHKKRPLESIHSPDSLGTYGDNIKENKRLQTRGIIQHTRKMGCF